MKFAPLLGIRKSGYLVARRLTIARPATPSPVVEPLLFTHAPASFINDRE